MTATARSGGGAPFAGVALAAAAALAAVAVALWEAAVRGWLVAWLFAMSCCVGAGALLLIHSLTGGRWRAAGEPWLLALSSLAPWVALGGGVVLATHGILYPWAHGETTGAFQRAWFAGPFFVGRGIVILLVWGWIGLMAPRGPSALLAALGLAAYGATVSAAGVDWVLSLDPEFRSTDFAAMLAISQIGAGLALCAARGAGGDGGARRDWGGLMIAAALGALYLSGMQFLVSWSGDLPHKAAWYGARTGPAGEAVAWGALILGATLPVATLTDGALRGGRLPLRIAGIAGLGGIFGRPVHLADGRGDRRPGLHPDSILQPKRDVVAGYAPIMPSDYARTLKEGEVSALAAYLRSLSSLQHAPEDRP